MSKKKIKKESNGQKAVRKNGNGMRIPEQTKRIGRPPKYPWTEWFSALAEGRSVVVKQGEDFDCQIPSMIVLTRNAAKKRGLSVSLSIKGQSILISWLTER